MITGATPASDATTWEAAWAQALPDARADGEVFTDVTLRSRLRGGIGGRAIRVEFSNKFADEALVLGRVAVAADGSPVRATFNGTDGVTIPAGESAWTDSVNLFSNQIGVVLQMKAKAGKGQALFDLATDLHHLWKQHDVRGKTREPKQFHHPEVGTLTSTYEALDVRSDPGLQLIVHHAQANSPTAVSLALLGSLKVPSTDLTD